MSSCFDIQPIISCFVPTDATVAPVSLLQHLKFPTGGGAPSVILTTAEDTSTPLDPATYLGGGTLTAGACQLPSPDIEWVLQCELLADGTKVKFYRRCLTTFDALSVPTTAVADFEEDKVTPYVVVDESAVGVCPPDCPPLANAGLQTSWADFN